MDFTLILKENHPHVASNSPSEAKPRNWVAPLRPPRYGGATHVFRLPRFRYGYCLALFPPCHPERSRNPSEARIERYEVPFGISVEKVRLAMLAQNDTAGCNGFFATGEIPLHIQRAPSFWHPCISSLKKYITPEAVGVRNFHLLFRGFCGIIQE